jgi:hypothetical protein
MVTGKLAGKEFTTSANREVDIDMAFGVDGVADGVEGVEEKTIDTL